MLELKDNVYSKPFSRRQAEQNLLKERHLWRTVLWYFCVIFTCNHRKFYSGHYIWPTHSLLKVSFRIEGLTRGLFRGQGTHSEHRNTHSFFTVIGFGHRVYILFFLKYFLGDFCFLFSHFIQHCFICRPSDSTVPTDAGIEPRTVATCALAVRRSNLQAISQPLLGYISSAEYIQGWGGRNPCQTSENMYQGNFRPPRPEARGPQQRQG